MQERVFLEADVHKHRLEVLLNVFDAALVDAADNVAVGLALNGVFLEDAALEERSLLALGELFGIDNELVAGWRGASPISLLTRSVKEIIRVEF